MTSLSTPLTPDPQSTSHTHDTQADDDEECDELETPPREQDDPFDQLQPHLSLEQSVHHSSTPNIQHAITIAANNQHERELEGRWSAELLQSLVGYLALHRPLRDWAQGGATPAHVAIEALQNFSAARAAHETYEKAACMRDTYRVFRSKLTPAAKATPIATWRDSQDTQCFAAFTQLYSHGSHWLVLWHDVLQVGTSTSNANALADSMDQARAPSQADEALTPALTHGSGSARFPTPRSSAGSRVSHTSTMDLSPRLGAPVVVVPEQFSSLEQPVSRSQPECLSIAHLSADHQVSSFIKDRQAGTRESCSAAMPPPSNQLCAQQQAEPSYPRLPAREQGARSVDSFRGAGTSSQKRKFWPSLDETANSVSTPASMSGTPPVTRAQSFRQLSVRHAQALATIERQAQLIRTLKEQQEQQRHALMMQDAQLQREARQAHVRSQAFNQLRLQLERMHEFVGAYI